jgi:fibronectin type 3 domain-containing protein
VCEATLIELSSFIAAPKSGKIIISWNTESETDNAGFNIYRSESENGEYVKINNSIIPTQGSSTQGASYQFIDNNVKNRKTYHYKLEDVDLNGTSNMHGPVSATPRWIFGIFGR